MGNDKENQPPHTKDRGPIRAPSGQAIVDDVLNSIPDDADPQSAVALARLAVELGREQSGQRVDPAAFLAAADVQNVVASMIHAGRTPADRANRALLVATALEAIIEKLASDPVPAASPLDYMDGSNAAGKAAAHLLRIVQSGGPPTPAEMEDWHAGQPEQVQREIAEETAAEYDESGEGDNVEPRESIRARIIRHRMGR
jgi:hypothetical protein